MDLIQFISKFSNDKVCEEYLHSMIYKEGVQCPYCQCKKVYKINTSTKYQNYKCSKCSERFSVVTRTIFDKTRIPLQKWFIAIFLLSTSKKGISSVELSEKLSITQKTAWFLLHRIRECMQEIDLKLFGTVEIDETFVGGKEKNKHAHKKLHEKHHEGKTAVMGAISRENKQVIAYPVKEVDNPTAEKFITNKVEKNSMIYADNAYCYDGLVPLRVNHGQGEYVRGEVHTNSIESFWAIIKRGYVGIYHQWSKKHLKRYIREYTYKFNNKSSANISEIILHNTIGRYLSYKMLIRG